MKSLSVVEMLNSGHRDLEWFSNNLVDLKRKFNNNFIAIHDTKVIDSDTNLDRLITKLKSQNVDTNNVLIEFVTTVSTIL